MWYDSRELFSKQEENTQYTILFPGEILYARTCICMCSVLSREGGGLMGTKKKKKRESQVPTQLHAVFEGLSGKLPNTLFSFEHPLDSCLPAATAFHRIQETLVCHNH